MPGRADRLQICQVRFGGPLKIRGSVLGFFYLYIYIYQHIYIIIIKRWLIINLSFRLFLFPFSQEFNPFLGEERKKVRKRREFEPAHMLYIIYEYIYNIKIKRQFRIQFLHEGVYIYTHIYIYFRGVVCEMRELVVVVV